MRQAPETEVRLAELIAALSLATDLGMGQPLEHALRTCLAALRLGERLGLDQAELGEVYYLALLRRIGCTSDSFELGRLLGDDLAAHSRVFTLDFGNPLMVVADMLRHAGEGRAVGDRLRTIAAALAAGPEVPNELFRASCEVARQLAEQLGFGGGVLTALGQTFERWDGRGSPARIRGEEIALAARIVQVAEDAEVYHGLGSVEAAVAMARRRSGTVYDPAIAEHLCRVAPELFRDLDAASAWDAVLDAEPGPRVFLSDDRLDAGLRAIAHFVDVKSPDTAGHSSGVAELAGGAAARAGLPQSDVVVIHRAAFVHDLGRVGVPNGIWDKPGPLTDGEWERVRLHPYYSERVLTRPRGLAPLAGLAGLHHERLDARGYHRGASAGQQSIAARILGAADAYHAMTEPRPHRPALSAERASDELRREVRAGRLDGSAVDAVLAAAGHRLRRRREWPAALSSREVEVLRLLARGRTKRDIARELVIAEATTAAHIRHIYDKIGVSTRAAATLFAVQHDLLESMGPAEE